MIALMMSVFCMSSCSNEEDGPTPGVEDVEGLPMDDVAYVRSKLVSYNARGEYLGFVMGSPVYPDMPTTLYVGVDGLDEALMQIEDLIPSDAKVKEQGSRKVVTLTDQKGATQGEMYICQKVDEMILAEVSFSREGLIDEHVSAVRFIPANLWPDNDLHDGPMKVGQIWRHKRTGDEYVCMREPETKKYGLLFRVRGLTYIHSNDVSIHPLYFPARVNLSSIATILKGSRPDLWDVLAQQAGMDVENLKTQSFFFNKTVNKMVYALLFNNLADSPKSYYSKSNVNVNSLPKSYVAMDSRIFKVSTGAIYDGYTLKLDCGFTQKPDEVYTHDNLDNSIFDDLTLTDEDFELVR